MVTVCNVHLPSARQLGREGAAVRRIEELAASIQSLPDVVLGDFNEPPGGAVTQFISRNGYQDAAVLMGRPDVPTSVGGSRGDQIWVRSDLRERVLEYGVLAKEDLAISLGEKVYLSDHVPLWVRLEAGGQREV